MSGPGGRWPAGKGMKTGKSTRTWTHPAPASAGYDRFCLAPGLGSKPHCLSGSPVMSQERQVEWLKSPGLQMGLQMLEGECNVSLGSSKS